MVFQLVDFSDNWWRGVSANEMEPPNWNRLITLFVQEYFPSSWREKKHQEFMDLVQENMSVFEYRIEFMQLLRFFKGEFPTEKMLK